MAYVILFDPTPLFSTYVGQRDRLLGLSALTDQKLAGVVMMTEQLATVGLAFVLLLLAERRSGAACGADGRRPGRLMRSAWSFTFEPLFAVLGAVALGRTSAPGGTRARRP